METRDYVTVGDVSEVFDGPHATPNKTEEGPYFLSISSLESGKLDLTKSARLSEKDFIKWTKRVTPEAGDILFSYETRLGEAALMPAGVKACLGRRMGLLRPIKEKVIPEYLLYAYLSPSFQSEIERRTNRGATVDRIALKELPNFPIRIPALKEQNFVAGVLQCLDKKIELNTQLNQTLEAMAQALFKSWFVDFDPAIDNALATGNPIPEPFQARAQRRQQRLHEPATEGKPLLPSLPAELRKLFPDSFQEIEALGWVPMGWEIAKLGDLADLNWGDTKTTKSSYIADGYVAYSAKGPDGFLPYYDFDRTGVVISAIGANAGYSWLALKKWSCIKNTLRFWSTDPHAPTEYLYFATLGNEKWPLRGSAQPFIAQSDARKVQVLKPQNTISKYFSDYAGQFFKRINANNENSALLKNIRDELLPKLLSGQLRIPEAEAQLTEADA